jgi:hypothetical protein
MQILGKSYTGQAMSSLSSILLPCIFDNAPTLLRRNPQVDKTLLPLDNWARLGYFAL